MVFFPWSKLEACILFASFTHISYYNYTLPVSPPLPILASISFIPTNVGTCNFPLPTSPFNYETCTLSSYTEIPLGVIAVSSDKILNLTKFLPHTQFSNSYIFATLWYFKLILFDLTNLRSMTLGCKDIGIRKSEFVAKLNLILENTTGLNDWKEWNLILLYMFKKVNFFSHFFLYIFQHNVYQNMK